MQNARATGFSLPLIALALSAFAIGTTEFVIMGILPDVAQSLSVSVPDAGLLVSGYALGVAVGAPILAVMTSRMSRKSALLLLMGLFIVGNVLCATANGYAHLMVARVITSFAHGSFFGIGSVVAASLVSPEKRASAVALMFTGLALANVLGVPFGTFIGQSLSWRAAFWVVAVVGVLALVALAALVPNRHDSGPLNLSHELGALKDVQVLLALAMTVLGFGGVFVVFTYIAPILEQISGFPPRAVSPILILLGIGLAIGNTLGGKLADHGVMSALATIFAVLIAVTLIFGHTMHHGYASVATLFFWGIAAFATIPALQTRALSKAANAPNLAATLNIGAFNLGNALGAWLGGAVLTRGYALGSLPYAAASVTVLALLITALAMYLDKRGTPAIPRGTAEAN